MSKFRVGAIVSAYFTIPAKNEQDAREFTYDKFPTETEMCLADGTPVRIFFNVDDVPTIESLDLMDTSNNHCKYLVEKINKAWNEKQMDFVKIVRALAERDNEQTILAQKNERKACHDYCQHIADNEDLVTILSYCRM